MDGLFAVSGQRASTVPHGSTIYSMHGIESKVSEASIIEVVVLVSITIALP